MQYIMKATEEHTVRLISHKCDIESRKELIVYISRGGSREHGCRLPELACVTSTVFEYETHEKKTIINLVDYNHESIDFKPTAGDIVYADLSRDDSSFGRRVEENISHNTGIIRWLEQFRGTGASIWYFNGLFGKRTPDMPEAIKTSYSPSEQWSQFIKKMFGIGDAIQTTAKLLSRVTMVEPSMQQAAPWPVPRMVITVPKFVTIESIKHNPETGEIVITFG
jgi:hypothetical protein